MQMFTYVRGEKKEAAVTVGPLLFTHLFEVASAQAITSLECLLTLSTAALSFKMVTNPER